MASLRLPERSTAAPVRQTCRVCRLEVPLRQKAARNTEPRSGEDYFHQYPAHFSWPVHLQRLTEQLWRQVRALWERQAYQGAAVAGRPQRGRRQAWCRRFLKDEAARKVLRA